MSGCTELYNRHIGFIKNANIENSKSPNGTLDCSLDEWALLKFLKANPSAKQTEMAKHIGKSERNQTHDPYID